MNDKLKYTLESNIPIPNLGRPIIDYDELVKLGVEGIKNSTYKSFKEAAYTLYPHSPRTPNDEDATIIRLRRLIGKACRERGIRPTKAP